MPVEAALYASVRVARRCRSSTSFSSPIFMSITAATFPRWLSHRGLKIASGRCPFMAPKETTSCLSTTEFVADFFGDQHGAYRYLSELLEPGEEGSYKLQPHNVTGSEKPIPVFRDGDLAAQAVRVIHGGVPALAWRIEIGGKHIVFTGDTNGEGGLTQLAANADLLIAHNAVPEGAVGVERKLHMPPSVIGQIAADAHVKHLVLSHRMLRTLGKEDQTRSEIRKRYAGPLDFANDLDCFAVQ
jgi:ribonuclease BN (tRNA processing enzyme)